MNPLDKEQKRICLDNISQISSESIAENGSKIREVIEGRREALSFVGKSVNENLDKIRNGEIRKKQQRVQKLHKFSDYEATRNVREVLKNGQDKVAENLKEKIDPEFDDFENKIKERRTRPMVESRNGGVPDKLKISTFLKNKIKKIRQKRVKRVKKKHKVNPLVLMAAFKNKRRIENLDKGFLVVSSAIDSATAKINSAYKNGEIRKEHVESLKKHIEKRVLNDESYKQLKKTEPRIRKLDNNWHNFFAYRPLRKGKPPIELFNASSELDQRLK